MDALWTSLAVITALIAAASWTYFLVGQRNRSGDTLAAQYAELIKVQGKLTDELLQTMRKRELDYAAERGRFVNTVLQSLQWTGKISSVARRLTPEPRPPIEMTPSDNGSPQSRRLTEPNEV